MPSEPQDPIASETAGGALFLVIFSRHPSKDRAADDTVPKPYRR